MDRTTGKTLSDAYVEFVSYSDMQCAIEQCNMRPLKGRIVGVQECSQEEFLRVVFPKWRGKFIGTTAVPPDASVLRTMSTAAGGNVSGACPPFVTREEINSLLVVCRNYKVWHLSIVALLVKQGYSLITLYSCTFPENALRDHLKTSLP